MIASGSSGGRGVLVGLETNVLLRYLVRDEPQAKAASEAMDTPSAGNPGWISPVVFAELVWSLRRTYKVARPEILAILDKLLGSEDIVFQEVDAVRRALSFYRNSSAGFQDCVVACRRSRRGVRRGVDF